MTQIASVGVVGLGTMGAGIVEVFARGGLRVVGVEMSPELAERGEYDAAFARIAELAADEQVVAVGRLARRQVERRELCAMQFARARLGPRQRLGLRPRRPGLAARAPLLPCSS